MTVGGRGVKLYAAGLVAAMATALLAVLPIAGAQAAGDLVVWPDVDDINPKVTSYSITINDPEAVANLVARWKVGHSLVDSGVQFDYREVLLPHDGTMALPFAETFADNYGTAVSIHRCVGTTWSADSCVALETGPYVEVWVEAETDLDWFASTANPTPQTVSFTYYPPGLGTSQWRLLAADGSEMLAGTTPLGPGGQFTLAVPAGTPEQDGTLEVLSSLDGTVVGHLDGHLKQPFGIDGVPPPVPQVSLSASVVYPHDDDYLDSVTVTVLAPGADDVELQAVNEATGAAHPLEGLQGSDQPQRFEFKARSSNYRDIPSGTYRIRVIASDHGGKSGTISEPIEVRGDRLKGVTWRRTVRAVDTVIKKYTGPCGTLRKPAEPGWRGSLGYYSSPSCNPKRSFVQVIHAMTLPHSMNGRYSSLRISLKGGPNRKQPGSYLVLGYYTNAKKWEFEHREVFRGRGVQDHHGHELSTRDTKKYLHEGKQTPYVAWSTGLSQGSRYDVKSFTVEVVHVALVPEAQ